jgi:hypothetical protein
MRSLRIVVFSPLLDDDLGFFEAVEYLSIQELVAEPSVEALAIAVLPRRSRFDIGGLGADSLDPLPDRIGNELGSVVGTDIGCLAPPLSTTCL